MILDGSATLELWPSPVAETGGARPRGHQIRPGHVVARPPGSGVGHAFRAGPEGVTMLIYGTRKPTTWPGSRGRARSTGAASA